ncbi:hypothetical protein N7499_006698 [Penicillium canescens]|uniref:Uncharacterized protein n=1 Tax=Penicillium canescens TaxID=5083 RepID=A0AAD6IE12_PENCN|nr:uncharacterized protein N7446_002390 [Penicillium canescens]KAJ6044194.1 hypothetical protein N7460_005549 [Penicillium canescens]KAJ6055664.1 hypothetical protein N7444_004762 [Penicillium canescens]KAJ6074613.1 hypothetical protein N7446_002390 [Penicillium canescens]KAJ6081824.1 hypothetical protein N7499_006698 [Penicillium canescens]KAJ6176376.1 hypothetical protein N7485_003290 [Penicillium canescens]
MDSKLEVLLFRPRDLANHRDRKEITDASPRSSLKYQPPGAKLRLDVFESPKVPMDPTLPPAGNYN